jgi:hypothetical protein
MRLTAAVLVTAAAAALAATAGSAPAADVTLKVERYFDPACTPLPGMAPSPNRGGCHRLRFAGTISSGVAGEYVSVLYQRCGSSGLGTSLVGAQTKERGAWDTFWGVRSGTFRARWGNSLSDPVRFRDSVWISVTKLSGFSHRVSVSGDQDMKGRIIELQRLVGGQWRLFRRARLVDDRITYGVNSTATFAVRKRGLVLRAFVPAKSAAPCYLPTASEQWTSGVASGTSGLGARVIDRTLLCSTALQGGIRLVSIRAANANATGLGQPPTLSVSSGFAQPPGFAYASTAGLTLYPDRCKQTRARVPLEAGSLKRAPPGLTGRTFDCEAPPRVLLRIRAVFREPATLESNRYPGYQTLSAQGDVSEAAVAVRTPSGKPLAFAAISGSKARLFAARGCVEDDT